MRNSLAPVVTFVVYSIVSFGCAGGDGEDSEAEEGVATEAECPTSDAPTYESFGRDFMETYCTSCHSSALSGSARNGAPDGHDFDSLAGVLLVAEHIDELAAAGPAGVNEIMPESAPGPSEAERRRLGEWLACEVAHSAGDGATH